MRCLDQEIVLVMAEERAVNGFERIEDLVPDEGMARL